LMFEVSNFITIFYFLLLFPLTLRLGPTFQALILSADSTYWYTLAASNRFRFCNQLVPPGWLQLRGGAEAGAWCTFSFHFLLFAPKTFSFSHFCFSNFTISPKHPRFRLLLVWFGRKISNSSFFLAPYAPKYLRRDNAALDIGMLPTIEALLPACLL
jgi:hypothetical protein